MAGCRGKLGEGPRGFRCRWLLCVSLLLAAPTSAEAFELSGGVSLGGVLAGTKPRFAVTPQAGMTWRLESGVLFAAHEALSILPATDRHGAGVYNQMSIVVGYGTERLSLRVGPALSIYSMPACNRALLCGRVVGLAPGGQVQANLYFVGPLGVSVSASVDYVGGSSPVLPGSVAVTVNVGPVLRWAKR